MGKKRKIEKKKNSGLQNGANRGRFYRLQIGARGITNRGNFRGEKMTNRGRDFKLG